MKIFQTIEKYFWVLFLGGLVLGLCYPLSGEFLLPLLKPSLMIMLFFVFLKTDIGGVFEKIKDYKLMVFLVTMFMLVVPFLFFLLINIFSQELAIGILLLTAMPAGAATPALTDIVKGNTAISASIVILTSLIAPFTVPILFWLIEIKDLSISPLMVFKDLATIVFFPMIVSQIAKKYFPKVVQRGRHMYTSFNIIILALMVYVVMGTQQRVILENPIQVVWHLGLLYLVFILLHVIGYFLGLRQDRESKVALAIGSAYMNNSMAIVLAAVYFSPTIVLLMILSEIPWNTLLQPFKRLVQVKI